MLIIIQILFLLLGCLINFTLPASCETSPARFVDFSGPFLSDPVERQLLTSKIKGVWLLEDNWNATYVKAICQATGNQDPSTITWFLGQALSRHEVKQDLSALKKWLYRNSVKKYKMNKSACRNMAYAPEQLSDIFSAIVAFDDPDTIRQLFPMAMKLWELCKMNKNTLHYSIRDDNVKRKVIALIHMDDISNPLPDIFSPKGEQRQVSAEEAEAAVQYILDAGVDANKDREIRENMRTVLLFEQNRPLIDRLLQKFSVWRLLDISDDNYELVYGQEKFMNDLEYEIKRLISARRAIGSVRHLEYKIPFHKSLPSKSHPKYAHMARLFLDMVNWNGEGVPWNSDQIKIVLECGLITEFMRDDSEFQILESGLTGPVWDRIRPFLNDEFVAENDRLLALSLPLLDKVDSSTVDELVRTVPRCGLTHLLEVLALPIDQRSLNELSQMKNSQKVQYATFLFRHPELGLLSFDDLLKIRALNLASGGVNGVTFDQYSKSMLAVDDGRIPSVKNVKKFISERDHVDGHPIQTRIELKNSQVEFVHGRTAYLKEAGKAMKFEKQNLNELEDEMRMDLFLQKRHADLQLTSALPENPILYNHVKLDNDLVGKLAPENADYTLHETDGLYRGLKFDVPAGYNIQIHQQNTHEELLLASKKSLGDAAILAKKLGLVSVAPADLYHNLEGDRRYKWNIRMAHEYMSGAGRLDQWRKAVKYVNMGQNGIRDLKHYKFIDELQERVLKSRVEKMFTHLGNFLFSWMLSIGEWFLTHGFELSRLQNVLSGGLSTFLSNFSQKPMEDCTKFVGGALRLDRLARQMQYFMSREYVKDINGMREIPDDIYGPKNRHNLVIWDKPYQYWNEEHGWMRHDGSEDLGPYNGPFPITEMIRTIHIVVTTAMNLK